jgi:hypothetical protein
MKITPKKQSILLPRLGHPVESSITLYSREEISNVPQFSIHNPVSSFHDPANGCAESLILRWMFDTEQEIFFDGVDFNCNWLSSSTSPFGSKNPRNLANYHMAKGRLRRDGTLGKMTPHRKSKRHGRWWILGDLGSHKAWLRERSRADHDWGVDSAHAEQIIGYRTHSQ